MTSESGGVRPKGQIAAAHGDGQLPTERVGTTVQEGSSGRPSHTQAHPDGSTQQGWNWNHLTWSVEKEALEPTEGPKLTLAQVHSIIHETA